MTGGRRDRKPGTKHAHRKMATAKVTKAKHAASKAALHKAEVAERKAKREAERVERAEAKQRKRDLRAATQEERERKRHERQERKEKIEKAVEFVQHYAPEPRKADADYYAPSDCRCAHSVLSHGADGRCQARCGCIHYERVGR